MIYWITCSFMSQRVMGPSRKAIFDTMSHEEFLQVDQRVILDARYPMEENGLYLKEWAESVNADLICPPKNLGGHGGFNYALNFLKPQDDDDIIFIVDPDSYPLTSQWFSACINALNTDYTLGGISLTDLRLRGRPWSVEAIPFAPRVGFLPAAEMWNMSAFRFKVLREKGFIAHSELYGHVETAMWNHMHGLGLRHGYLMDYFEGPNPAPHDELYTQWKMKHANGVFKGNFDEYLETIPLHL